jgi:hypothetical protein
MIKAGLTSMAKSKRTSHKKREEVAVPSGRKGYGESVCICLNAGCLMRKKAKCLGFEGCPGFKGR